MALAWALGPVALAMALAMAVASARSLRCFASAMQSHTERAK